MNNVGVVGIGLDRLAGLSGSSALKASGNNFGNMLFTNAAYSQIEGTKHIGFKWRPSDVRQQFNALLIPAANWINAHADWGWLADQIEEAGLPTTVIGLGTQLQSLDDVKLVPDGTRRFLKVVSSLSHGIGVRGQFTADCVALLGVDNAQVLGCPSLFNFGLKWAEKKFDLTGIKTLGIAPTRYVLPKVNSSNKFEINRQLYQFGLHSNNKIFYQSEAFEIAVLAFEELAEREVELALKYYGFRTKPELVDSIQKNGHYHTNLASWIEDASKIDFYVGTRIHGAIAATLAGKPAMLLTHDRRTSELADYLCIPSIDANDFNIAMLLDIPALISGLDFDRYQVQAKANFLRLKDFYLGNGLKLKL